MPAILNKVFTNLGGRILRAAGITGEQVGSILRGGEKAFPGIGSMSREQFLDTLKSGKFATEYADEMGGPIARKELANITSYMKQGNKLEQGMQSVHLPQSSLRYETKAFAYIREGEVVAGGYMYRKSPNADWVRAGLYSAPTAPKSVEKYSIAKVLSAQMAAAGGHAPKSLSAAGAKSYYDTYHAMKASVDMVKAGLSGATTPGVGRSVRRGGSRQGPRGGT